MMFVLTNNKNKTKKKQTQEEEKGFMYPTLLNDYSRTEMTIYVDSNQSRCEQIFPLRRI